MDLAARALPLPLRRARPTGTLRGESTPFYLYNRDARRRIAVDSPDAKLIAVLRDPVDRAYSNWMHLWMDGLEPRADIVEAVRASRSGSTPAGRRSGTTSGLGMYGRQVEDLFDHVPREQVLLLRYETLVDEPDQAWTGSSASSGSSGQQIETIP